MKKATHQWVVRATVLGAACAALLATACSASPGPGCSDGPATNQGQPPQPPPIIIHDNATQGDPCTENVTIPPPPPPPRAVAAPSPKVTSYYCATHLDQDCATN